MRKTFFVSAMVLLFMAPLAAQSVTVVSPNGGERWILGETKAITWKAENWTGNVNISIRKPTYCSHLRVPYDWKIAHNVPAASGRYMWIVGRFDLGYIVPLSADAPDLPVGCNCFQIIITSGDGSLPSLSDKSDNAFYICRFRPKLTQLQ